MMVLKQEIKNLSNFNVLLGDYIKQLDKGEINAQQLIWFKRGFEKLNQDLQEYSIPDELIDSGIEELFLNLIGLTSSLVFEIGTFPAGVGTLNKSKDAYITELMYIQGMTENVIAYLKDMGIDACPNI